MALIIKGGEIPVDCLGCDEMFTLSQCPIHMGEPLKYCNGTRHPDCPIIGEIPDEHGDLKDETDIIHRIEKIADADLAQDIIGEILASPTIVEATE